MLGSSEIRERESICLKEHSEGADVTKAEDPDPHPRVPGTFVLEAAVSVSLLTCLTEPGKLGGHFAIRLYKPFP